MNKFAQINAAMKDLILKESTSIYLLSKLYETYSDEDKLEFMSQVISVSHQSLDALTLYIKDKKRYIHPNANVSVNDYVHLSIDYTWLGNSDLKFYKDNNLIRDNSILVKVSRFKVLQPHSISVMLKSTEGNYQEKEVSTSYIKKVDLY